MFVLKKSFTPSVDFGTGLRSSLGEGGACAWNLGIGGR